MEKEIWIRKMNCSNCTHEYRFHDDYGCKKCDCPMSVEALMKGQNVEERLNERYNNDLANSFAAPNPKDPNILEVKYFENGLEWMRVFYYSDHVMYETKLKNRGVANLAKVGAIVGFGILGVPIYPVDPATFQRMTIVAFEEKKSREGWREDSSGAQAF